MNFATVIGTFSKRPARQTIAGIAAVFAGLILVTPQGIAASGHKESTLPATAKPASNSTTHGTPQKTDYAAIIARFIEFTDPAFAEVTAPGGVLEKFGPAKAPANIVRILPPEQLEAMLRVLHRMKGVDILTTPSVIAKSGHQTEIEMAREIKYATEWVFDKKLQQHTPTAFEVKKAGVMMESEATVKPGGEEIDLHAIPQIVEFLGFQSTGSEKTEKALTEKPDPHHPCNPVFRTRNVDTHVELVSGQTLLIWLGSQFSEKDGKPSGQRAAVVLVTPRSLSDAEAADQTRKSAEAVKEKAH